MSQQNSQPSTLLSITKGLATITLNQPKKHNAFNDEVIDDLLSHLNTVQNTRSVRVLLLQAEGKHFCAGADLSWMKRMGKLNFEENHRDAKKLALLMSTLNALTIPSIVKIQGAAYGGAIGLIACCDIAISADNARFCLSEVKLGLAPATIGPYVIDAMGARRCRELFLSARVFNAAEANSYGLLHQVCSADDLDKVIDQNIESIMQAGPIACKAAKKLIQDLSNYQGDPSVMTSELIASLRVSKEGQEGLAAFFDKRPPSWRAV